MYEQFSLTRTNTHTHWLFSHLPPYRVSPRRSLYHKLEPPPPRPALPRTSPPSSVLLPRRLLGRRRQPGSRAPPPILLLLSLRNPQSLLLPLPLLVRCHPSLLLERKHNNKRSRRWRWRLWERKVKSRVESQNLQCPLRRITNRRKYM